MLTFVLTISLTKVSIKFTHQPNVSKPKMEIQNLRLQLLHIANGNVKAAKEMENYVLGESTVHAETHTVEANEGNRDEDCGCFICCMRKAIEEGGVKFN